jgi:hypothetical protein
VEQGQALTSGPGSHTVSNSVKEGEKPVKISTRAHQHRWTTLLSAGLAIFTAVCATRAQSLYLTNLDESFVVAKESNRTVILYTGRVIYCGTNDPRSFYFNCILKQHPQLAERSNKYVVCEKFIVATNGPSGPTREFFRESAKLDNLYSNYDVVGYSPTLTFIDANGHRINGPFWGTAGEEFISLGRDCYETLRDYLADDPPLRTEQARSNLIALACSTNSAQRSFGLYRYLHPANPDSRYEILLGCGTRSGRYRIGAPFEFAIRETVIGDVRGEQNQSLVGAVGRFDGPEALHDSFFMVNLNGAWFRAELRAVGNRPDRDRKFSTISLEEGEFYFGIYTATPIANLIFAELNRLKENGRPESKK